MTASSGIGHPSGVYNVYLLGDRLPRLFLSLSRLANPLSNSLTLTSARSLPLSGILVMLMATDCEPQYGSIAAINQIALASTNRYEGKSARSLKLLFIHDWFIQGKKVSSP